MQIVLTLVTGELECKWNKNIYLCDRVRLGALTALRVLEHRYGKQAST